MALTRRRIRLSPVEGALLLLMALMLLLNFWHAHTSRAD
jgi:hypothetical protein